MGGVLESGNYAERDFEWGNSAFSPKADSHFHQLFAMASSTMPFILNT